MMNDENKKALQWVYDLLWAAKHDNEHVEAFECDDSITKAIEVLEGVLESEGISIPQGSDERITVEELARRLGRDDIR